VAARDEVFSDAHHRVGDTVEVGRERFGNDRDPHVHKMGAPSMRETTAA
jgi:hypothetical protein